MTFRSDDLSIFFGAFGVAVDFNGSTAQGLLDQPEQIRLADHGFGGIEAERPVLKLAFNAFSPMPAVTDAITVDGQVYTIAERTSSGDNAIAAYALKGPIS
jgi:hypothetical protein